MINGLPRWLSGKKSTCQCKRHKDEGLIPGSGRSPGRGNGNPLQYFCLEHPMDREVWRATVPSVAESDMTKHTHMINGAFPSIPPLPTSLSLYSYLYLIYLIFILILLPILSLYSSSSSSLSS